MNKTTYFWGEFLKIVDKYSERPAIVDNNKTLTYIELAKLAAKLGEKLKQNGVTYETPVGLSIDKSAEYIIALLAVWYAGGAFVPMPTCLPKDRQEIIKHETNMQHILTAQDIDSTGYQLKSFAPVAVKDDTLAYIIYTSGSTGKPKGVMVEHRGIVPFINEQKKAFQTDENSRYLFYLSIGFDASISDIGVTLLSGSALVIAEPEKLKDGVELINLMHEQEITHADIPPALLKIIDPVKMPSCLETIIIGGEVCPPETIRNWANKHRIINVYGPTEATVCTSLILCSANTWDKPLIGEPMAHVKYRTMNEELYIGGNCLARGYLNEAILTDEKFVLLDNERFYKTGDKVLKHSNNSIEFLGRIDRQFKLRGQLIEPEEIEMCLKQHSDINKIAVLKRSIKKNGADALIAFITVKKKPKNLDDFLKKSLPSWMIPQHIEMVEKLPETITGKIDYTALKTKALNYVVKNKTMPTTKTEQILYDIWKKILKHDDFGINDSFFSVGGDSLNAMNLTIEAEKQDVFLPIPLIISKQSIHNMAKSIDNGNDYNGAIACDTLKKDVAFNDEWLSLFSSASKRKTNDMPEPKNIFITGATGFLGGYLLKELLDQTTAEIYCLIRAENDAKAYARLSNTNKRIHIISGDLAKTHFGLDKNKWEELTEKIDTIYHCAAWVNIVQPYEAMRSSNISGTLEVLRLACTGQRKHIHYASTLSVFVATDKNTGTAMEADKLQNTKYVYGGYAQTKWAAEYMLLQVPENVCTITNYRFGLITGDTKTGKAPQNDLFGMFIKGIKSLGVMPKIAPKIAVDITPIDYASKAMAHLSLHGKNKIYHIANKEPLTLTKLLKAIKKECPDIKTLSEMDWDLYFENRDLEANEAATYLSLCRNNDSYIQHRTMDLFQATDIYFDTQNTDNDYHESCPKVTDELLSIYIKELR